MEDPDEREMSPDTEYERSFVRPPESVPFINRTLKSVSAASSAAKSATRKAASNVAKGMRSMAGQVSEYARNAGLAIQPAATEAVDYLGERVDAFDNFMKPLPLINMMFTGLFRSLLFVFSRGVLSLPVEQKIKEIEERKRGRVLDPSAILEAEPYLYTDQDLDEVHQSFIEMMGQLSENPNANYDMLVALLFGIEDAPYYYKRRYPNEFVIEELINLGFDTTHIDTMERQIKTAAGESQYSTVEAILKTGMIKVPLLPIHMIYGFVLRGDFDMFLDVFDMEKDKMGFLQGRVKLSDVNQNYFKHIDNVNERRRDWIELDAHELTYKFRTRSSYVVQYSLEKDAHFLGEPPPFQRTYPSTQTLVPMKSRRQKEQEKLDEEERQRSLKESENQIRNASRNYMARKFGYGGKRKKTRKKKF